MIAHVAKVDEARGRVVLRICHQVRDDAVRAAARLAAAYEAQLETVYVEDEATRAQLASVDFADICITSDVTVTAEPAPEDAFTAPETFGVGVVFQMAEGEKCQRCWKILPDVGTHAHPGVCARCNEALG